MNEKIAIITGGSRGLGRNAALHLARKGVDVIITYHSRRDAAETLVAAVEEHGARAAALQLDTADCRSFEAFAAEVKALLDSRWQRERFDYLVNNAGIGVNAAFAETTEEQFDRNNFV